MKKSLFVLTAASLVVACTPGYAKTRPRAAAAPVEQNVDCITEKEVVAAQKAWGEGIVRIGKVYSCRFPLRFDPGGW